MIVHGVCKGTLFHFVELVPAMTLVDSSASFEKRCSDIEKLGLCGMV